MANIEKRTTQDGKINYRVKVRLKGYPVQSATFERITDAKKWSQNIESAMREGRHFKTSQAKRHTLAELVDRYLKDVLSRRPKTKKHQEQYYIWWKKQIGSYLLADVTPALIVEQRDKLVNGITHRKIQRSPATVNRYTTALSCAFSVAIREWEWLEENPFRKVSKLKEPRGRVRYLSDDERTHLLQACKNSRSQLLYLIFVVNLSTGARKNEILGLTWENVDLVRKVITLRETKNGEIRLLPLAGHALDLMTAHSKVRRLDTNFVFPSPNAQKPLDIRGAWETAVQAAGIKDFRFHDLRHSTASYLAMNGASLAEIAEVLGHKTLAMVKRYSHLSEAHTARVVTKMNEKILDDSQMKTPKAHPKLRPNYDFWIRHGFWKLVEATLLLLDIEPRIVYDEFNLGRELPDLPEGFQEAFQEHFKLLETGPYSFIGDKTPKEVLEWAQSRKIPIPKGLRKKAEALFLLLEKDTEKHQNQRSQSLPMKNEEIKPKGAESSHGNTLKNQSIRENILGAALAILAAFRDGCEDKNKNIKGAKIAKLINDKAQLFWPDTLEPPMSQEHMARLFNSYLRKTK